MALFLLESNTAGFEGKQRVITTQADADTGPNFGTPLAHEDHAGGNLGTTKMF